MSKTANKRLVSKGRTLKMKYQFQETILLMNKYKQRKKNKFL